MNKQEESWNPCPCCGRQIEPTEAEIKAWRIRGEDPGELCSGCGEPLPAHDYPSHAEED